MMVYTLDNSIVKDEMYNMEKTEERTGNAAVHNRCDNFYFSVTNVNVRITKKTSHSPGILKGAQKFIQGS